MQGQRGAIGSFPETFGFEHGSMSSDTGVVDQQIRWEDTMPNSTNQDPPERILSLGDQANNVRQDPFELGDRRSSRKRKHGELSVGQSSSGTGSSSMFQRADIGSSTWRAIAENPPSDEIIPRLGLNVTGVNQTAAPENFPSNLGQPVLRIPALRRNFQSTSRWSRNSSSRAHRSTNLVISGDRNELDSRNTVQTEVNWNSNSVGGGGGGGVTGAGASAGQTPSSANRSSPNYHPRRLSAFLRRSLLSAADLEADAGLNSNLFPRIPPLMSSSASASQDLGIPPVVSMPGHHHQPQSRSSVLLGRQLEASYGLPFLSRSMASGSEGRGRLVSEIRNVLDLMRRGEPLRFEDLMILDQSVFYGIADVHDRHRDMRLDIDNMSYEELLALEERIGNVNTGLAEEMISKNLKHKKYVAITGQPGSEPCSICQEEFNDGDDLGALECSHQFHCGCIKQWLQQKNSCPICKSTGFSAT